MKDFQPKIAAFLCNWCAYAGADLAGVSRIQYPAGLRTIRVMCSGRVDPSFIINAFMEGCDGVLVSGWHFGDCHYLEGNVNADKKIRMTKKLLDLSGVGSKRLHLEWVSSAEAKRFTEVAAKITDSVKNKGRLEVERLKIPLEAALMVVENASLRWLVGKELSIVSKGDVYGRKVDTESYEKSLDLLVEREYQNSLICIAIKNGFSSVRDISRETGIDLLRVSYLLADLERTGRVEFLQMTDRVPSFAVI